MSIKLVFDTVTELNEFFNSISVMEKEEPIQKDAWIDPVLMDDKSDDLEECIVLDKYFEEPIPDVEEKHPWNDSYVYDWDRDCFRTHNARGKVIPIMAGESLDLLMLVDHGYSAEEMLRTCDFCSEKVGLHTVELFLLRCKQGKMTRAIEHICNNEHVKEDFTRYKIILDEMKEE